MKLASNREALIIINEIIESVGELDSWSLVALESFYKTFESLNHSIEEEYFRRDTGKKKVKIKQKKVTSSDRQLDIFTLL